MSVEAVDPQVGDEPVLTQDAVLRRRDLAIGQGQLLRERHADGCRCPASAPADHRRKGVARDERAELAFAPLALDPLGEPFLPRSAQR